MYGDCGVIPIPGWWRRCAHRHWCLHQVLLGTSFPFPSLEEAKWPCRQPLSLVKAPLIFGRQSQLWALKQSKATQPFGRCLWNVNMLYPVPKKLYKELSLVRHQGPNNRLFPQSFLIIQSFTITFEDFSPSLTLKWEAGFDLTTLQIDQHHERWIFLTTGLKGKWICAGTHVPWDVWAKQLKMLVCPDLTRLAVSGNA